jgi:sec-independent protein translocase protein TatA
MFGLGGAEIALLMGIGVLLFGNKLPQVGASLAKTILSFKNALNGVEEGIESAGSPRPPLPTPPERMPPPRFEGPRDEPASPVI